MRSYYSPYFKFLLPLFIVISFFVIVLTSITPRWETNDDAWMLMLTHGYGIESTPVLTIFASNPLVPLIARNIPHISGASGYTIFSYFVMFISLVSIFSILLKFEVPFIHSLFILFLIGLRPLAIPQFTLTAGLVGIAGLLNLYSYCISKTTAFSLEPLFFYSSACTRHHAFFSIFFLALCFCIRDSLFLPLVLISLPFFLTFKNLFNQSVTKLFFIIFLLILCLWIFDKSFYFDSSWDNFKVFPARKFYDFGMYDMVVNCKGLLSKFGYTTTEFELLNHFFYFYPLLKDLRGTDFSGIISHFSTNDILLNNFSLIIPGIKALGNQRLLPLFSLSLIGAFFSNAPLKLIKSIVLFFCVIISMSIVGRPAVLRMYEPLLYFLVSIVVIHQNNKYISKILLSLSLCIAFLYSSTFTYMGTTDNKKTIDASQVSFINDINNYNFTIVRSSIDFEYIYAPFSINDKLKNLRYDWLVPFIITPVGNASKNNVYNNFLFRFISPEGINIAASRNVVPLLNDYCNDSLNGTFQFTQLTSNKYYIFNVNCLLPKSDYILHP